MRNASDFLFWFEKTNPGSDLELLSRFFTHMEMLNNRRDLELFYDAFEERALQGESESALADLSLVQARLALINTLRIQGIGVSGDILLGELLDLCEGIQGHFHLEDKTYVQRCLESYDRDMDLFIELMSNCCTIESETIAVLVSSLPLLYREALVTQYSTGPDPNTEEAETVENIEAHYKLYRRYKSTPSGVIDRYADRVAELVTGVGMPLATLLVLFKSSHQHDQLLIDEELGEGEADMAAEIFGLTLLSGDYYLNPLAGCQWACGEIYPDLEARRRVERLCRQIYSEVSNAKA